MMFSVRARQHLFAVVSLGATLFGLPGCGGQSGSPSKGGQGDGAGISEAADGSDSGGASCGTIMVTVGLPSPTGIPEGKDCVCDWQEMGADGSLEGDGGEAAGYMFTVTCLPASSSYLIQCSCSLAVDVPDGADLGPCTGGSTFSPVPGTTKNVVVDMHCPG